MTTHQAKKLIKEALDFRGLPYTKLTAKTIDFTDLARASCIFVRVHGWKPNAAWVDIQELAKGFGFRVET